MGRMPKMYVIGAVISALLILSWGPSSHIVDAFNVDTANYIQHEGQSQSMFGFSVALHQESHRSWVVIGAPRADTSSIQQNVQRGGAVYRCEISDDNRCTIIPFDRVGNQENDKGEQIDTKSDQWFGATVSSAGINGPLVACAPRYVFHTLQPRKVVRVEPVGTCYLAKRNFTEFTEYSPCRTMFWGYHKQGSCQAGMSAAITRRGDRLFIGAPGSWYWQGQAYSINPEAIYPYKPRGYGQFGEGGQSYTFSLNNPRDKVWSTRERTASEDDSYLGYSSAAGDFTGDGSEGVAVGMPRGGGLLGKVLIFSWNMTNLQNITGEQIGAYFGYSLCIVDVDGDHMDDLIIGAPMHTEPNNEGKYEMGRVYIMYQDPNHKFTSLDTRDGVNSKGRFGLSLTTLGDINLDGYGDFAVGAPYDGPHGRGAVYIYHGSKRGPLEKPSQVIFAEDVAGSTYLGTFGFSISGGIDLDGNMYPDLVVGAYEANKVIVFKSRPVINMTIAETTFDTDNKLISLDDKRCKAPSDQRQLTCTKINSCLAYNGINLPTFIDIEVSWLLDAKKLLEPRLFFLNEENKNVRNSTMRLYRGRKECRSEVVYIGEIRDKLTPLEVEMKYRLRDSLPQSPVRRKRGVLEPVLDQNFGTLRRDSINIQKNCGSDNICIPDLRLSVKTVDTYLLGSDDLLVFEILVTNYGEDAFDSAFIMNVPQELDLKKTEVIGDDTTVTCTAPSIDNNNILDCRIGNPLPSGKIARFKVYLKPTKKNGIAPKYDFYLEANSTNSEEEGTKSDNVYKKTVAISFETSLSVKGGSTEEEAVLYNLTEYTSFEDAKKESDIGPQVVHMYEIRNGGPSTIEEAEIYFLWPYESISGDPLVYLLDAPETTKNVQCEPTSFENARGLLLDQSLVTKSFLVSRAAVEKSNLNTAGGRYSSSVSVSSSSTSHGEASGARVYSEEEKRRIDAEENRESSGDASFQHTHRAKEAAAEQSGGRGGNYEHSYSSSWNSSSQNGGPPITYSTSRNRSSIRDRDGHVQVSEYSTENYGGVSSGSYNNQQQQQYGRISSQQNQRHGAGSQDRGATNEGHVIHRSGFGNTAGSRAGFHTIDEIPTEENISQDISGLQSRTQSASNNFNSQSGSNTGSYSGSHSGSNSGSNSGTNSGSNSGSDSGSNSGSHSGRRRMMSQQDGEPPRPDLITGVTQLEKVAQGGHGFQAGTLDLGIMGRDNVDDEIRRHGNAHAAVSRGSSSASSSNRQQGGGNSYQQSNAGSYQQGRSGGFQQSSSSGYNSGSQYSSHGQQGSGTASATRRSSSGFPQHSSSYGGGSKFSSNNQNDFEEEEEVHDDGDYYDGELTDNNEQQGHNQHHQQQFSQSRGGPGSGYNSGIRGNPNSAPVDSRFKHYDRMRRDAPDFGDLELKNRLQCNSSRCAVIRCTTGPLVKESSAWVALRMRLVAHTINILAPGIPLNISTMVLSRVSKLPYIGSPYEKPIKEHEIKISAIPIPEPKPDIVPLWVFVLAACCGVLILLLLILLLYKCGFFKRNRPDMSQERQPLNRNGAYHGDEHL